LLRWSGGGEWINHAAQYLILQSGDGDPMMEMRMPASTFSGL
jgi:hypothetical protein